MDFSSSVTERMCKQFLTTMAQLIDEGFLGYTKGLDGIEIGMKKGNFILAYRE
jgi:hypothetical protein